MKLNENGLLEGVRYIPSPNCDDRPSGCTPDLLVIHNISLPPNEYGGDGVIELFTNRLNPSAHPYYLTIQDLKVSTHFWIRRDGEIVQFVPCDQRARHAGASRWRGKECCNDFSIGVELEGSDFEPFTDQQYTTLVELTLALRGAYSIVDIAGHSDVAPGRKTDPGPYFDWPRYRNSIAN